MNIWRKKNPSFLNINYFAQAHTEFTKNFFQHLRLIYVSFCKQEKVIYKT